MILKSPAHPSGEGVSLSNVLPSVFIRVHPWLNYFFQVQGYPFSSAALFV
jgi:hypothetical protein